LGDYHKALVDLQAADRCIRNHEHTLRVLAKTKYLLKDYKGALFDLNRANRACTDNHITLRCDTGSNSRSEIWSSLVRNP
jgi:hypothetical protein